MAVRLIMFNNGLQILGTLESKGADDKTVVISKPVQLVMVPSEDPAKKGQVSMAFAPFLQYITEWESGVTFMITDVLTVSTPVRDLENNYNGAFGSGLVMPPGVVRG